MQNFMDYSAGACKKLSIEKNSYNVALDCEVAEGSWQSIKDPIGIAAHFEVRVCSSG